jgi:type VI secretion system protein ImpA
MKLEHDVSDLEAVLAPIPGDNPTGVDLRQDTSPRSIYFRLRDARAEARDAERQADTDGGEAVPTRWRPVAALALEALEGSAKDLEVATWLTEALVRTTGLSGLSQGASIIAGLVERYWDALFPMPDEDGMETRLAALAGLSGQGYDGTLLQPLRKIALFRRPDGSPFGLWQYEASLELAGIADPERRAQRIEAGVLPFADVENEARIAGQAHWSAQRDEVSTAMACWADMGRLLDEKAGAVSPSGSRVRDLLQLMLDTCNRFAPPVDADGAGEPAFAGAASGGGGVAAGAAHGAIAGREQALRQLGEIAAWFKRTEPHSPLAYTLEEAVRRGRMGWPDLIEELLPDESTRHALLTSLGIKP